MSLAVRQTDTGAILAVKVVPGSSRSCVAGHLGSALKVRIAAPAEKGRANKELVRVLAKLLGVPGKAITIVAGEQNANKQVHIAGVAGGDLIERLGGDML